MASSHTNQEKAGDVGQWWGCRLRALPKSVKEKVFYICGMIKKIGQDDPRRVIHSLKVGLALSLVSLFYYYRPLYDNFGLSAMWAVVTVIVVFEFTVGATLGKGLNRGMATLLGGALGVGAHYLAILSGQRVEPILLGFFVFLQAVTATFMRFFPKVKARYDYGLLIFILTFTLISVSGFRDDEILEMAQKRLATIFIGGSTCVVISILVCPVWAGEELHNSIALNLEKLGNSLQAFEGEYFRTSEEGNSKDCKSFLEGYTSVLNSKSTEESLANFASWEPGHGKFQFCHPWGQYLKIGTLTRQCAYRLEALRGHLSTDIQAYAYLETWSMIQEMCSEMSLEAGKAMKELGLAIRTMTSPSSADNHIANSKAAIRSLKSLLQSIPREEKDLLLVITAMAVASLQNDIVDCAEKIADSVNELASLTGFEIVDTNKSPKTSQPPLCECDEPEIDSSYVVILVEESALTLPDCGKGLSDQHNKF